MAGHKKKVLIVGAGVAGGIVAEVLKQRVNSEWVPVAFVDDDPKKQTTILHGLPVLGNRHCITNIVKKLKINYIVIAMPSVSGEVIKQIVEICQKTKVQLKILPGIYDLITGKIKISDIRDIEVEDLLGRSAVTLNINEIANYLTDKVVLITGAGGSIGSEICRQIAVFEPKMIVLLGHGENSIYEIERELKQKYPDVPLAAVIADIRDCRRVSQIFNQFRPAVVFHAAAHKHVPLMEKNQEEAVKNNIQGTRILTEAAHLNNTEIFVLISTDKAVNPTSVMGATKRAAEMVIQWMNGVSTTNFVAVRFGNVLGSRGSVIPLFKKQIASGGPVTVTHPAMKRYFMTIYEAVQLVIQAGALARGGEIFVLDMGQPIYITDLAKNLIRLSGYEPGKDIAIQYTGIRPGEKYEEKLYSDEEQIMPTKHERIFKIASKKNNFIGLIDMLEIVDQCNYSNQELLAYLMNVVGLKQN
ncbi:NDP-sugar epimerase, includes UDP-GlcNAc-inverting 4,6-dehydratase FlaA1 and capsular polysaccharide biosynthesis protein EpsC [Desulfotomaculum arcticum]|uniref:NDP-sugar epimerase, includes UDP-GlcNAc-inverting 4,6-dehydratase FlaA1 and capsular polysaccharide biosynthesis protein EpsC n=1 Tax=Desulfotruncus arcticus DSM 17038 TaxID=1121424 RepID=A0A1I2VS39_9FIRM|nr:nucleoside-diphosphate sugar epimerase/dehydratase [Desulfotruncus arcticus]SFG90001.1 NDP-sugar epimerase, includes UDP-GlcNAc-inverting 4,6-dehydratase FlaA1 and capsular polysaccharide biosynthesis protein EpsC [Desulfotomaculum arcticum] [Desulfotruncus arcticus DSM 17038]